MVDLHSPRLGLTWKSYQHGGSSMKVNLNHWMHVIQGSKKIVDNARFVGLTTCCNEMTIQQWGHQICHYNIVTFNWRNVYVYCFMKTCWLTILQYTFNSLYKFHEGAYFLIVIHVVLINFFFESHSASIFLSFSSSHYFNQYLLNS
jgi:hypothetical protein